MSAKSKNKIARNISLRLLYGFASVIFISLITFLADEVAPGDAAMVRMGEKNFTQERYERLKTEMGLDRPWYVRYVEYFSGADTNEQQRITIPEGASSYQLSIRGFGSGTIISNSLSSNASQQDIQDEIISMMERGGYEQPNCEVSVESGQSFLVLFTDGVGGLPMDDLSVISDGNEESFAEEVAIGRTVIPLGNSYYGTRDPVYEILGKVLPISMQLAVLALLLATSVGLTLGTVAAIYENRAADRVALSISTLGVTLPNFVLAPVLAYLFVFYFELLPLTWKIESQMEFPKINYMILPVIVLAARPLATLTRLTRAAMIDTLNQEFIKLAVAKGVPSLSLYLKHGLRNAILPILTGIGTSFGYLLTGSFIVETFFRIPGIGYEAINAIQKGDAPVIMACVIVSGSLFIVVNLIVDLAQQVIDPRIRESQI